MTENQAIYKANCSISKSLCLQLEKLTEDVDYHTKSLNYERVESCNEQINEIRMQLQALWDIQIDLFFSIQEQYIDKLNNKLATLID